MVFIETKLFTRQVLELLSDDEYAVLQARLKAKPDAGATIAGTGGARKIRVGLEGRGKRGGARAIYYWAVSADQIYMLALYAKNEQADLTPDQKKVMGDFIKEQYPK